MADRRPRLDRETILAAATELVARDGLDGLSMRRLAAALGVAPMATYRHFADRAAIVDALIDAAATGIRIPAPTGDWRADLGGIARALRITLMSQPALVEVVISRPALGPGAIYLAEAAYAVFVPADSGQGRPIGRPTSCSGTCWGSRPWRHLGGTRRRVHRCTSARTSSRRATRRSTRRRCLSRCRSSRTRARFVDDEQFEWGLAAILDGIAARHPGD